MVGVWGLGFRVEVVREGSLSFLEFVWGLSESSRIFTKHCGLRFEARAGWVFRVQALALSG